MLAAASSNSKVSSGAFATLYRPISSSRLYTYIIYDITQSSHSRLTYNVLVDSRVTQQVFSEKAKCDPDQKHSLLTAPRALLYSVQLLIVDLEIVKTLQLCPITRYLLLLTINFTIYL